MATTLAAQTTQSTTSDTSLAFERFAGICALLAGVVGLLYSVGFVLLQNPTLYSLSLLLGGLLTAVAMIAVYERLRGVDRSFALLGLILAAIGAVGSAIHG